MKNRSKNLIFISIFSCTLVVVIVIFILAHSSGSPVNLVVNLAPSTATIMISEKVYSNGNHSIAAGNYTGTISSADFEQKTISFTVKDNEITKINEYLVPSNQDLSVYESSYDDTFFLVEYAETHPEDLRVTQFVTKMIDKIETMKNLLPIYHTGEDALYDNYAITDGSQNLACPIFCVYIEASTPSVYQDALSALGDLSKYPLEDYIIINKIMFYPLRTPDSEN